MNALLAVIVPLAVLWSAPVPFGWRALAVVHLIAGLPLALAASAALPARWWMGLVGVVAAVLTFITGDLAEAFLGGASERFAARVAWCLALQLPWAMMRRVEMPSGAWMLALGALLVPGLYGQSLTKSVRARMEEDAQQGRPARALAALLALRSANGPVGYPSPTPLRRALKDLEVAVNQPLESSLAEKRQRVIQLGMLARHDEAATVAEDLPPDAQNLGLLGLVRQQQGRWAESDAAYGRALELEARPSFFDALAFNAREQGEFDRAAALYREAIERLPGEAAYFHFQLARHFKLGENPGPALSHAAEAARLDPTFKVPAEELMKEVRRHTPGCLLPR